VKDIYISRYFSKSGVSVLQNIAHMLKMTQTIVDIQENIYKQSQTVSLIYFAIILYITIKMNLSVKTSLLTLKSTYRLT